MRDFTPEEIDALLPQTQCGLCGYGGCLPYAEAMVYENAPIHLCPPGGVKTLKSLAELLQRDPTPFIADMQRQSKPPMLAVIRENECIGCVKCIQACPVDAIVGSAKQMHTIIAAECTGCGLCVPPCPVDCIDMITAEGTENMIERANHYRMRYHAHEQRVEQEVREQETRQRDNKDREKKRYIQEAVARAKAKHHSDR